MALLARLPNHWVETDAADRASHPKRSTRHERRMYRWRMIERDVLLFSLALRA